MHRYGDPAPPSQTSLQPCGTTHQVFVCFFVSFLDLGGEVDRVTGHEQKARRQFVERDLRVEAIRALAPR
jgi:hypothetical protein